MPAPGEALDSQPSPAVTNPVLRVDDLVAGYGKHVVLDRVSFGVGEGELAAIVGHNGAGKTTALRAIVGLVRPTGGSLRLDGTDITAKPASVTSTLGISLVPQGQGVFPSMTVDENLKLAAAVATRRRANPRSPQEVRELALELFPVLQQRPRHKAGSLSGGQRQMLAISMALMTQPRVMLLDEPSTGLAPVLVDEVLHSVRKVNRELGTSVLLVEQDINRLLTVADRVHVIKLGRCVFAGMPDELRQQDWSALF